MNNDFDALDAYGVLADNTLMGHLELIKNALAAGINPHARIIVSRVDINGFTIYDDSYGIRIDPEQQIVFMECFE